jgi:hypothetical protein
LIIIFFFDFFPKNIILILKFIYVVLLLVNIAQSFILLTLTNLKGILQQITYCSQVLRQEGAISLGLLITIVLIIWKKVCFFLKLLILFFINNFMIKVACLVEILNKPIFAYPIFVSI